MSEYKLEIYKNREVQDIILFVFVPSIVLLVVIATYEQHYGQFFEMDPSLSNYIKKRDAVPTLISVAITVPISMFICFCYLFVITDNHWKLKALKICILLGGLMEACLSSQILTMMLWS